MLPKRESRKLFGTFGENYAASLLRERGYKILKRNFRSKFGEIDIICQEKDTLVFVEVKTRFSKKFGNPEEAVTPWKLRKIAKTGQYFSFLNPTLPEKLRIEVVAIEMKEGKVASAKVLSAY